jgi:hypothetical protein
MRLVCASDVPTGLRLKPVLGRASTPWGTFRRRQLAYRPYHHRLNSRDALFLFLIEHRSHVKLCGLLIQARGELRASVSSRVGWLPGRAAVLDGEPRVRRTPGFFDCGFARAIRAAGATLLACRHRHIPAVSTL